MGAGVTTSVDELLVLVYVDPQGAVDAVMERLAGHAPSPSDAAQLLWVSGLAERELGHLTASRRAFEQARTLALTVDDRPLAARVAISLAFEIGHSGDLHAAMDLLAAVAGDVDPADHARLSNQRGVLYYRLGLLDAAAADLEDSRRSAALAGDVPSELRALLNLGAIHGQRADHDSARMSLTAAIELAFEQGEIGSAALALSNLAYVEMIEGNLPEALDAFASAEDGFRRVGSRADLPRVHANHALALAEANLLGDAEALIEEALRLVTADDNDVETAELLLISARINLAQGDVLEARDAATEAGKRFERQGRDSWLDVAARIRLRAEALLTPDDPLVADQLVHHGRALARGGWRSDAIAATLLAALLHVQAGRHQQAAELVADVGLDASRSRATDRILLARVVALLCEHRGDRAAARREVTSGLRVAATSQTALGSLEARSHAAQHGAALVELGARLAVADRRPRELLHRIEAMRTMVWHSPLVRPPDDGAMAGQLAELRRWSAVAANPDIDPDDRLDAERQRLHVERTIRDLARRARGMSSGKTARATDHAVAEAIGDLTELGDRQLIAYANLTGELFAVTVDRGRCRLHDLGSVAALDAHLEACSFAIHRLNRAQGSEASRAAARSMLGEATEALVDQLVPLTIGRSDRPLVVVPTGALHGVPWTALDGLAGRAVTVSPSLSAWSVAARAMTARAAERHAAGSGPRREQPCGFVAGPTLRFAEAEVQALARSYERAVVLVGGEATAGGCVDLFAASEMVHLACHGSFRSDNPLFSTLSMADGPLTVYDLERVARMPEIVVLSACSVATSAAINGGTLLGLSSALGAFGASDVIAPLTPVNDEAVAAVMQRFHDALASGLSPSVALASAARPGGELDPVAAAFVVIGA